MTMQNRIDQVTNATTEASSKAAEAFDDLRTELGKNAPSSDSVVKHAGVMWTESMRFWAELWLAPAEIAQELAGRNAGGNR